MRKKVTISTHVMFLSVCFFPLKPPDKEKKFLKASLLCNIFLINPRAAWKLVLQAVIARAGNEEGIPLVVSPLVRASDTCTLHIPDHTLCSAVAMVGIFISGKLTNVGNQGPFLHFSEVLVDQHTSGNRTVTC